MNPVIAPPPERFNFAQYLIALNTSRSTKAAYVDDVGTLTYANLADRVGRVSGGLGALGVRREERVLLLMHDCNDWPVAFLGALHAGVVPVAVNTLLTADDYAYMLEHSRAQVALVSAALLPTLQAAMQKSQHEVKKIIVSRGTGVAADVLDFESWVQSTPAARTAVNTGADEIGFWLYSSGSTGRPKGTAHTHGNLYWTAALYAKPVLGLTEQDVCFSAAKLFFAYGLGNGLSFPLSVGATTVLMAERPTPDACFKRFTDLQPTVFFGAPTGYAGMLASANLPTREAVKLRMCSSAGEALPREIGEKWTAKFGCEIIDGIGSTEMLHIFLSNRPGDVRYGTTGKPVPGYAVELRDEMGHVLTGNDEVGDLYISGPSAALMYWGNRAKSDETFRGAWTKSGDKYFRDADGYYVYAGRSDDMLKVSGQYVSPFEVESTLMQHPAVLESAVIGVDDESGLTRAKAFVVLKDAKGASEALAEELKTFVKAKLAPYKYPRQLEFLAELPKTATGKIQRFKLRDLEKSKSHG
ncbi:MAG: benzoate-CoA ligase family protein [Burkholderiales bacterium]|nr:benzoate-CoA ligase family protein [Burkholderiales bacterium]